MLAGFGRKDGNPEKESGKVEGMRESGRDPGKRNECAKVTGMRESHRKRERYQGA